MYKAHRQNIYGGPYMALLGAFRDSGGKGGLGLNLAKFCKKGANILLTLQKLSKNGGKNG